MQLSLVADGTARVRLVDGLAWEFDAAVDSNGWRQCEPGEVVRARPFDGATIAMIATDGDRTASFWLDQVSCDSPIWIPSLGILIWSDDDTRKPRDVLRAIAEQGGTSVLGHIRNSEEMSFVRAASTTYELKAPTWLGVGRDFRTFELGLRGVGANGQLDRAWDWIAPRRGGGTLYSSLADTAGDVTYRFFIGRGLGPQRAVSRSLRGGYLPILDAELIDGGIDYLLEAFVVSGDGSATRGTHHLLSDGHGHGNTFTEDEQLKFDALMESELPTAPVLYLRVVATNRGKVARYAFFHPPRPYAGERAVAWNVERGLATLPDGTVYATVSLDGEPVSTRETTHLLSPGQSVTLEVRIPHAPAARLDRAALLASAHDEAATLATDYWTAKVDSAASVTVPERRIEDMMRAGLIHLDLTTYGEEPHGPLATAVGLYTPIGTESSPIIQFFDSMGMEKTAERALDYFFAKQRSDGSVQIFGGYEVETEAMLFTAAEHLRYTASEEWACRVLPNVMLAVTYIQKRLEAERSCGSTLLRGKTADPDDPFASYMLNGYAYGALRGASEIARVAGSPFADRWMQEAEELRADIRRSFFSDVDRSPVVPLGDGSWVRSAPPWAGERGPISLRRTGEEWFSHGSVAVRDSLLGPLWLVPLGVLEPDEPIVSELLEMHAELFTDGNVALSQPYYSPHPQIHLSRGEPREFLAAYYRSVASLADRETFTFWEHFYHVSPHKTHEEAWFLMQTRWMLYREHGSELTLFGGVPRAWIGEDTKIELEGVCSHFGPIDVTFIRESLRRSKVSVRFRSPSRMPQRVHIRLPDYLGRVPARISAGELSQSGEFVTVRPDSSTVELQIDY